MNSLSNHTEIELFGCPFYAFSQKSKQTLSMSNKAIHLYMRKSSLICVSFETKDHIFKWEPEVGRQLLGGVPIRLNLSSSRNKLLSAASVAFTASQTQMQQVIFLPSIVHFSYFSRKRPALLKVL